MSRLTPEPAAAQFEKERAEYHAWEATRRIDGLVAKHVFGWHWFTTSHNSDQKVLAPDQGSADKLRIGSHVLDLVPPYSADVNTAWQVVEKMREHNYRLSLRTWVLSSDAMAVFIDPGREWAAEGEEVTTDSAPLAICRAALRVFRVVI
jgi:hypothetical protein